MDPMELYRLFTMYFRKPLVPLIASIVCIASCIGAREAEKPSMPRSPFADWVEPDFPFFSSILDAREGGEAFPTDNLTPRGLVFNLGDNLWVCFDTDLLRVAAIWQGPGVTPDALGPKSYHPWGKKTQGGQGALPKPDGALWLANGIYPGWQSWQNPVFEDPRSPAPSPEEVGRGPLPEVSGRFEAIQITDQGPVLEYTAGGVAVRERYSISKESGQIAVTRNLELGPAKKPLLLIIGTVPNGDLALVQNGTDRIVLSEERSFWCARIPAHNRTIRFAVTVSTDEMAPRTKLRRLPSKPARKRWAQSVDTEIRLSSENAAYVADSIPLPLDNPWQRNIRPGDIQFLEDGTGVVPTLDGDVWLVRGIQGSKRRVQWKRFASGLHEPMTAAIRDGQIYVFDRNGIWRLRDTNGTGEADRHELFSNAFAQTADMREFPSTLRLAPGGEFVIAKGGQQASTLGKHNGSVLRVSADGRQSTVLGYGFRQPSIGVNLRTGLVTSSDQEGQYIPSTPLHLVRDHQFYGYLSEGLQEREKYPAPIAKPLTWLPHTVNASATSQVWLFDAKMGPLNDSMVHIGFNRPELFQVLFNYRGTTPQVAVISITTGFDYPPLNGSVHPVDGWLYIAGFQINGWGNALDTLAGLGRVRYTGKPVTLPRAVTPMDKGVLLSFAEPLKPETATDPDNYSLASWHYKRTYKYGSPQYRADGETGIDWLTASSAYLSRDGRSVFVGVPDIKPVMQLRIGWALQTSGGSSFANDAYTTPYDLVTFNPTAEGFDPITVDLTPRTVTQNEGGTVSVEEGRLLTQMMGCAACHSTDGQDMQKVGPTWSGLYESQRPVVIGDTETTVTADEHYLRESIYDPTAKAVFGFHKGEYAMPSYAGVLTDAQVESLILFIKTLEGNRTVPTDGPG